MDNSQEINPAESSDYLCNFCGLKEGVIYNDICQICVYETLVVLLPLLRQSLEVTFGEMLDNWLTRGHFFNVR